MSRDQSAADDRHVRLAIACKRVSPGEMRNRHPLLLFGCPGSDGHASVSAASSRTRRTCVAPRFATFVVCAVQYGASDTSMKSETERPFVGDLSRHVYGLSYRFQNISYICIEKM